MVIYYRDELQSYIKASLLQALRSHAECLQKERGILMKVQGENLNADSHSIKHLFKIYQQTFGTRPWLAENQWQSWQEDLQFIFRYQGKKNPHALLTTMKELWYYGPQVLKNPVSTYSREVKSYARHIHIEYYKIKSQLSLRKKYISGILTISGHFESKHEIGDLLAFELLQKQEGSCIILENPSWTYIGYEQSVLKIRSYSFRSLDLNRFLTDYNEGTSALIASARVMKRSGAKVVLL